MECKAYYDPKCEELARYFLADAPDHTDGEALELAGEIQQAVEDWWAHRKTPITVWLDTTLPAPANPLRGIAARRRPLDEIQRAHDLVGQFAVETKDLEIFEHVSALCWVLRHDHNKHFDEIINEVKGELRKAGVTVLRMPELKVPAEEL